jgi:putative ABC transport system permease protein
VTLTIQRQERYAIEDRLRVPGAEIYMTMGGCPRPFAEAVARLPGVDALSCDSAVAIAQTHDGADFALPNGGSIEIESAQIDYRYFQLFGIKPLAGRVFAPDHGADDVLRAGDDVHKNPTIVLNESAVRTLGFASPQAAVGQFRRWSRFTLSGGAPLMTDSMASEIVGVVPDFSIGSIRDRIEPTAYYIDPPLASFTAVMKLSGHRIPETVRAVKDLWSKQGSPVPFIGMFLSQYFNDLYADIERQATLFLAFSAVAIAIAVIGLLGLALYTAERHTKEIGLRKVMGARRRDILAFLLWQFARPVLWANVIAWPLAYLFTRRWLEGFAYHVALGPVTFAAAASLAILVALATVVAHALLVARAKPVEALRYE